MKKKYVCGFTFELLSILFEDNSSRLEVKTPNKIKKRNRNRKGKR